MEITNRPLHLDVQSSAQKKVSDVATSFIWIIILFDKALKYGDGAKFWGYVSKNAEPLCVEFCNFMHCHIFVKYLTS
jgi:hypothetical protein